MPLSQSLFVNTFYHRINGNGTGTRCPRKLIVGFFCFVFVYISVLKTTLLHCFEFLLLLLKSKDRDLQPALWRYSLCFSSLMVKIFLVLLLRDGEDIPCASQSLFVNTFYHRINGNGTGTRCPRKLIVGFFCFVFVYISVLKTTLLHCFEFLLLLLKSKDRDLQPALWRYSLCFSSLMVKIFLVLLLRNGEDIPYASPP